jgi:hypothetical protein
MTTDSLPGLVALIGAVVAIVVSVATRVQVERAHRAQHGEVLSAERAVQHLLVRTKYKRRTFAALRYHIGGYDDDELRRLLIRAGAIRFQEDVETWGLIARNEQELDEERFTTSL